MTGRSAGRIESNCRKTSGRERRKEVLLRQKAAGEQRQKVGGDPVLISSGHGPAAKHRWA